jgi:DNA-binding transcriptional MerR regulator
MDEHSSKSSRTKKLPDLDDDEFCVSITKAAELSGLSESQIRYLEFLPGISIGRRRPSERNRVYTKQDVRLLWWIAQQEARPSEIADYLKEHQEEILRDLGHVTLEQVTQYENDSAGHDVLISRLIAFLVSIWQEAAQIVKGDAIILSVIFGPQDEDWKQLFIQNCQEERSIDLANCLVAWSTFPKEHLSMEPNIIFGNLSIIFTQQSWYLPHGKDVIYDTSRFANTTDPFAVALLWLPLNEKTPGHKKLESTAQYINKSRLRKKLVELFMRSLKLTLRRSLLPPGLSASIYSGGVIGRYAVVRCLSLLLNACIRPFLPDCYCYVAKLGPGGQLEMLAQWGEQASGYLPKALTAHETPWWIRFVRERASLALAVDARIGPGHKNEYGSVVCLPLVVLENVVGVLGIENIDQTKHCLRDREGFTGAELLRYLICIAEIAAEYLNLMETSAQKAERSKLAYASEETVGWWLDIYHYGGSDYSRIAEKIYDWIEQAQVSAEETINLVLIDIYKEGELAAKYQGFEVVIEIVRQTRDRIQGLMQNDPILLDLSAKKHLVFFNEPIGEHLLLATVNVPENYLLILLEQIRQFWQEAGDTFRWKGIEVKVVLQVGVCRFAGLAGYERKVASRMTNYHLKKLAQQMYTRHSDHPLNRVLEYDAVVITEKVVE